MGEVNGEGKLSGKREERDGKGEREEKGRGKRGVERGREG